LRQAQLGTGSCSARSARSPRARQEKALVARYWKRMLAVVRCLLPEAETGCSVYKWVLPATSGMQSLFYFLWGDVSNYRSITPHIKALALVEAIASHFVFWLTYARGQASLRRPCFRRPCPSHVSVMSIRQPTQHGLWTKQQAQTSAIAMHREGDAREEQTQPASYLPCPPCLVSSRFVSYSMEQSSSAHREYRRRHVGASGAPMLYSCVPFHRTRC
jgi:hypothetical protein